MALITYLTRVHFADGVFEEALRSELDLHRHKRPVIVAEKDDLDSDAGDRLYASFPGRTNPLRFEVPRTVRASTIVGKLKERYLEHDADALIAFGKARNIQLAQLGRIHIAREARGRSRGRGTANADLPGLFAIPGVDGLTTAPPLNGPGRMADSRYPMTDLLPTAIVCDPTLTLGASAGSSASAGVNAMARCMEAYLSNAYNPPADGIALDGLKRSANNLHRVLDEDRLEVRRELMAASLNGVLAQQKGIGTAQALGLALDAVTGRELDQGALERLLLPGILRLNAVALKEKYQPLRQILGIRPRQSLADGVRLFFECLPLPSRLSEMGVAVDDIERSAALAVETVDMAVPARVTKPDNLAKIMRAVL